MDERLGSTEAQDVYGTRIRLTRDGLTYGEVFVPLAELGGRRPESHVLNKVSKKTRRWLLQVLHSTRALDSALAAFVRQRPSKPVDWLESGLLGKLPLINSKPQNPRSQITATGLADTIPK